MSLTDRYHLLQNPFTLVPSRENTFWADRSAFKAELESALKFTLMSPESQIIACIYGDWGCGKTHAMTYFSNEKVLEGLAKEVNGGKTPLAIPTIFPTKDIFRSLFLDVIYRNLIPNLELVFKSLVGTGLVDNSTIKKKLLQTGMDEDLATVLAQFRDKNQAILVSRYLCATASRTDLDKLGIAKGVETNTEMLLVFSSLLKLFTTTIASRVFIWIDDCERVEEVAGKEMYEFQWFLRDMLDQTPERLTIIMNFTQLPGVKVPERMSLLGPAVQDRIAKVIGVRHFDYDEYLSYVNALLQNVRLEKNTKNIADYTPFTKDCLDAIYSLLETNPSMNLQPRAVNRTLSTVLQSALRDNIDSIDPAYLERVKAKVELAVKG